MKYPNSHGRKKAIRSFRFITFVLVLIVIIISSNFKVAESYPSPPYFYYNNFFTEYQTWQELPYCKNEFTLYIYDESTCSISWVLDGVGHSWPLIITCDDWWGIGDEGHGLAETAAWPDLANLYWCDECPDPLMDSFEALAAKEWDMRISRPGDTEYCEGKDNNCGGGIDEDCIYANPCTENTLMQSGGSTVNMASGNLQHNQTLFTVVDPKLPTDFTLTYNSLDTEGPLGRGWSHPFNISISGFLILEGSRYYVHQGYGNTLVLTSNGNDYTPEYAAYPILTDNTDGTFTLTQRDGSTYMFNASRQLSEIRDKKGNAIALSYTDNNLTSIIYPSGNDVILAYNVDDRIETITDPNNNVHTFTYTGNDLTGITTQTPPPASTTISWSYTYGSAGFMRTKTDPMLNTTEYIPDEYQRVKQTIDPEGNPRSVSYPAIDYMSVGPSYTTTFTERDDGIWLYSYDIRNGQLMQKKDPENNITTYTYYADGNIKTVTWPEEPGSGLIYPDDYITSYTYDPNGNISTQTEPGTIITAYTWTSDNQIDMITDPDSNVWDYDYYANGDLMSITEPSELNPAGVTTGYTYDYYGDGNIQKMYVTNPANQTTTYSYNTLNQLESVTDHTGASIYMTYYPKGNIETISDPRNPAYVYTFAYNSLNQLVTITDPKTNPTSFEYDLNGNLIVVTDANGNAFHYELNHEGRITKTWDDLNNITEFIYGGTGCASCGDGGSNLVSMIDANGKTWPFTNYKTGKREKQADPLGNETTFTYTARGQVKTVKDAATSTTVFDYNKRGLVSSITDALNKVTSFTYYGNNTVETRKDRKDDITTYTWTPDGKIDTITYQDTSSVNYDYDIIDRLVQMDDSIGTITYEYFDPGDNPADFPACIATAADPLRMIAVTDPHGFIVCYKFDEAGNVEEMIYPDGKKVVYTYDETNRLETVTLDWLTPKQTATYYYDPAGRLDYIENVNGTITNYEYDIANRLTDLSHTKTDLSVIASYYFELDGVGNRLSSDRDEPLVTSLTDELSDYTYNPEKNRLMTAGITSFDYDTEGQISSKDTDTYTFDYEHRLNSMTGAVNATFTYDGRGERLKADRNGVITYYVYDMYGNLLAEADAAKAITKYYVHGLGLMAMVVPGTVDEVYTYHFNAIGSTVAMTDANQTPVNMYAYTPFGIVSEAETIPQPFKYVGQFGIMHEQNGFYYMRARYYDPQVGRFVSEDPIGFAGGTVNLYEYVLNNPVNYIDPLGFKWETGEIIAKNYLTSPVSMIAGVIGIMMVIEPGHWLQKAAGVVITGGSVYYAFKTIPDLDKAVINDFNNNVLNPLQEEMKKHDELLELLEHKHDEKCEHKGDE